MLPAAFLPGEHEIIKVGPEQVRRRGSVVIRRDRRTEYTSGSRVGNPDTSPLAGFHVRRPDRPRPSAAPGEKIGGFLSKHMNEGDPRAVRRKRGRAVVVKTRTQPDDGLVNEIVDTDQRVAASMAHERQALAVRRPGQRVHCSLIDEQWLRVAIAARGHGQNSFLVDKQEPAAIGREAREVSRADLMRRAAGRGNQPYFPGHYAFRGVINVGRSLVLKTLAPCEGDRLRIWRPGEFADSETVVLGVRCDPTRLRAMGGVCHPDITAALRVEYPRDGCARWRGQHVRRKR